MFKTVQAVNGSPTYDLINKIPIYSQTENLYDNVAECSLLHFTVSYENLKNQ